MSKEGINSSSDNEVLLVPVSAECAFRGTGSAVYRITKQSIRTKITDFGISFFNQSRPEETCGAAS